MGILIALSFTLGCFVIGGIWAAFSPPIYQTYTSTEMANAIVANPQIQTVADFYDGIWKAGPWIMFFIGVIGAVFTYLRMNGEV